MIKKIALCVMCCAIFFWCYRIYSINQNREPEHRIQMGEELQGENMSIVPIEAHLFSKEDFLEYFHLTEEVLFVNDVYENYRMICVCLSVTNITEQDISWDMVMDATTCGFETKTWGSVSSPYEASYINAFTEECLRAGQSQKIWYVTYVNPVCFKEKTWEQMECKDFSCVLSQESKKISIQLE